MAKGSNPRRKRIARVSSPSAERPRAKAASRFGSWALGGAGVLVIVAMVALLLAFPAGKGPGSGRDVVLDVPAGESTEVLVARLVSAGLTDSPRLFGLYVRLTGGAGRVAPGAHLLTDDLSPRDIMARLERSTSAGHVRVTVPEGWTLYDIGRRLATMHVCTQQSWLAAVHSPELLAELNLTGESAEGFLFPATYELAPDSDAPDVVRRMKGEFDRRYAIVEDRRPKGALDLQASLGWGTREIVTLASMVEKEAVVDEERSIIASVFLNRLRDASFWSTSGKLLQCDPTAGYGCLAHPDEAPSCLGFTGKITHDIVADAANTYNTYKHEGLPPGPIANPGAKSLEAVLAPATTHYFYFVARGEGRHTFSETYAGHAAAVHGKAPGTAPSAAPMR
jgi:UPF0755 protein